MYITIIFMYIVVGIPWRECLYNKPAAFVGTRHLKTKYEK